MSPAVMRKLRAALRRMSFCTHKNSPQATMTRAAAVPMGAAYSPRPSERVPMLSIPPLRSVSEMMPEAGTPEASHRGMAA